MGDVTFATRETTIRLPRRDAPPVRPTLARASPPGTASPPLAHAGSSLDLVASTSALDVDRHAHVLADLLDGRPLPRRAVGDWHRRTVAAVPLERRVNGVG